MARILIMDDDQTDLASCERFFHQQGDDVEIASNADEGLSRAKAENFDVVMIDLYWDFRGSRTIKQPPMGLELLGRLHHDVPLLPIILITGFPTVETSRTARQLGAYDCLSKPPTPEWTESVHAAAAVKANLTPTTLGQLIARIGATSDNVLLHGPSNATAWVARLLHHHSSRREQPWVMVSCSDPEPYLERELFAGYPDEDHPQVGAFQEAKGGTIILSDVGAASPAVQARVRSMIENSTARETGWPEKRDVRIIATTEPELNAATFRPDLYHRISEQVIRISPQ